MDLSDAVSQVILMILQKQESRKPNVATGQRAVYGINTETGQMEVKEMLKLISICTRKKGPRKRWRY